MNPKDETERRRTRPGILTLEQILQAFERTLDEHIMGEPSTEEELVRLEQSVGAPLPASLRVFLTRIGGGLFFHGHEIFGPRRVMVHDIDLVPDMLTVRRTLEAQGTKLPDHTVPIHRARGLVHVMRLRPAEAAGQIESVPEAALSPNLESFLEVVVLPRVPEE